MSSGLRIRSPPDDTSPGRHETPVGDIYVVVEVIMLLPGKRAAPVRSECARLFVRFYGGDLQLAEQVIGNRQRQEEL